MNKPTFLALAGVLGAQAAGAEEVTKEQMEFF